MKKEKQTEELAEIEEVSYRSLNKTLTIIFTSLAVILTLVHLYILNIRAIEPWTFRSMHVLLISALGFALIPGWKTKRPSKIHWSDWLAIIISILIFIYIVVNLDQLQYRAGVVPTQLDFYVALIGVIMILELTRRTAGWALPILSLVFILYAFLGPVLPGIFNHSGYGIERFFSYIYSLSGVFGVTTDMSSKYLVIFITFGAFLQASKIGDYFVKFSFSVAGGLRGGPAKVAVLASGLMGTVSGTSSGNAVATGSLTIPLMKRVGYSPRFAAATEAAASTGGQILPPVMGAGAFLMAEIMGVPYKEIIIAALIPALLFYFSVYFMVDIEAIKLNLKGLKRSELPDLKKLLKKVYLFIPIIVVITSIIMGFSIIRSGTVGIIVTMILSWISKDTRMGFKKIVEALAEGTKNVIQLVAICASAGIIVGVIALTGIGGKFSSLLLSMGSASQILALFFAMLLCIVLGMGMPTTAAYAIAASVAAPGLINMGIEPLVAHMFVFYYAVLSSVTPPVAMAAFAAAGIAGTNPMKTSVLSFRLAFASFIVPFMFAFNYSLLMMGSINEIIFTIITSLIGVYVIAGGIQGYFFGYLNIFQRSLLIISSVLLINKSLLWDLVGVIFIVIVLVIVYFKKNKSVPSINNSA